MGKKLENAKKLVDSTKFYSLTEAIDLAKKSSYTKFDGSIDLALKLNLDVRQSDQQLRGAVSLPNGTGKAVSVLVATDDPNLAKAATEAGADIVANKEDLTAILQKGVYEFQVMVADPKMMPVLGRFGKQLGPKGLMPNPKEGTVTPNPAKAVEDIKKGKAKYRTDKNGIIHASVGRVSMETAKLVENANTLIDVIKKLKPAAVKGTYMLTLNVSASMGPAVKVKID